MVVVVPVLSRLVPYRVMSLVGLAVVVVALVIGSEPYWRYVAMLSAGLVMLLGPHSSGGVYRAGGQRFWSTLAGAAIAIGVFTVVQRRATVNTGPRQAANQVS